MLVVLRLVGLVVLAFLLPVAEAQNLYTVDTRPPRGFMPAADQVASPVDSIDPVNGKLHLQIPVASVQSTGGFQFDLDLVYDSHIWDMMPGLLDPIPPYTTPSVSQELIGATATGGWTYNFRNYKLELEVRQDADNSSNCSQNGPGRIYRLRVGLPDGSLHVLHLRGYGDAFASDQYVGDGFFGVAPDGKASRCTATQGWPVQLPAGWLTYYTSDGSFLKLEIWSDGSPWFSQNWRLYHPDGRVVRGHGNSVQQIADANGNVLNFYDWCWDGTCDTGLTYIENSASGRWMQIDYNIEWANLLDPGTTAKIDQVTVNGPQGNVTWRIYWQLLTIGGDGRTYQWSESETPSQQTRALYSRQWVVQRVELPWLPSSGTLRYEFGYSDNGSNGGSGAGYGELDYLKTPSGAEYNYRYRLEGALSRTEDIAHYNWVREKTVTHDGIPDDLRWTYAFTADASTITNPNGGVVRNYFAPSGASNNWASGLVYRIEEPNGAVRKRRWAQNKASDLAEVGNNNPNNPYIDRETATVAGATTAVTGYAYDKNGNLLQKTEYDWVGYAGPNNGPTGSTGMEAGTTRQRVTDLTYHVAAPAASVVIDDPNAYWRPHNPGLWSDPLSARRLDAVRRRLVSLNGSGIAALTEFDYDNPYTKGNVTSERRWDSERSAYVAFNRSYDTRGNLTDIYAPDVRTHITYDGTGSFPSRIDYAYGGAAQRSWQYSWNFSGLLNSKTDLDNNFSISYTYDAVGRLRGVNEGGLRYTETIYDDTNHRVTVKRDLAGFQDGQLQAITHYDQLGRAVRMRTSDGGPLNPAGDDGIKIRTTYRMQSGGRCVITSTPYRALTDAVLEWTRTQYDLLDRVTAVSTFRGSAEPDCQSAGNRTGVTVTAYDVSNFEGLTMPRMRITDPAGKRRDEYRDALGRLRQVVEDPSGQNDATVYRYDPLDNLTEVNQGAQTRTFAYSTLGRLVSSSNPEGNTNPLTGVRVPTLYTYDDSGDVQTRRDARGITATYTYDELHRLRTTTYSDGTPGVTFDYYLAGTAPRVGQLRSEVASLGATPIASTVYSNYDALGRVLASTHSVDGMPNSLTFGYAWRRNDSVSGLTYPSSRVVYYDADGAGRTTKVYTSSKTYADLSDPGLGPFPYTPDGRIAKMKLGNGLWETRDYQTPGAPTLLKLGTTAGANDRLELEYRYSPDQHNGNLLRHTTRRRAGANAYEWTQWFESPDSYDGMNRLRRVSETTTASSTSWMQTYGYDRYGNRWADPPTGGGIASSDVHEPTSPTNFQTATNRLYVQNSAYDVAGNQTFYTPYTLDYDAENRNTRMTSASSGNATFVYDGQGRRVRKVWAPYNGVPVTTFYVYNALGQLALEYSTQAPPSGTAYPFTDILGSTRAVTDASGSTVECYDYLPFGRYLGAQDNSRSAAGCYPNLSQPVTGRSPQKFTGKERDGEIPAGLDYFGARYLSAAEGRFTSIDPSMKSADLMNPQSWNRYSYTYNNPLRYVDRNGKWPTEIHEAILAASFPKFSQRQIEMVQYGSYSVDYSVAGQMLPSRAYQHGMRRPGETREEMTNKMEAFIDWHEGRAASWAQEHGVSGWALTEFGKAMHPLMDSTSPAHADQAFEGVPSNILNLFTAGGITREVFGVLAHGTKEQKISRELYRKNIDKVRKEFLKTFGQDAFHKTTGCRKVEECSYDYSILPNEYWMQ